MRFYQNFSEVLNELKRELKEMGINIHTKSVQNKDITNNPDYDSKEITNYIYTVLEPNCDDIPLSNEAWCHAEFGERVSGLDINPGNAWKLRSQYWEQFLKSDGTFDYAYPQRMRFPLKRVISLLKKDNQTRRAFLPIFDSVRDQVDTLDARIPCSLGYWFVYRQGQLNMTYFLRSSDFSEHFNNDIWLANKLKDHVAQQTGLKPGAFIHWLGSMHIFAKDVKDVF